MKISKLHIDNFRHLENLDFEFTYPKDFHIEEKRGKPLDKICFIGQSATGKTSLLELISEQHSALNGLMTSGNFFAYKNNVTPIKGKVIFDSKKYWISLEKDKFTYDDLINYKEYSLTDSGVFSNFLSEDDKKYLFYFKANIISEKNIGLFTKNPIDLFANFPSISKLNNLNQFYSREDAVIFDDNVDNDLWLFLLGEILSYRKRFNQKMAELIHRGLLANQKKLSAEFEKWQRENPNTLEAFAEKFNPILEKLNLEVDIIDTEYSIPIRNKKNEEIIPIQNTSTGTKGLLLSFLPLYKLDTEESIILIDEPERSLYPDMQMELMEFYQNLAPKAQFIVATHSPFIAAAFEPDERFILYFDEQGKVAVRRGSSPIGDDPNDMLKNDFEVNYYNKFGEDAYKKYLKLKEDLANEKDPIKKKEILLETVKLGDTYNF